MKLETSRHQVVLLIPADFVSVFGTIFFKPHFSVNAPEDELIFIHRVYFMSYLVTNKFHKNFEYKKLLRNFYPWKNSTGFYIYY